MSHPERLTLQSQALTQRVAGAYLRQNFHFIAPLKLVFLSQRPSTPDSQYPPGLPAALMIRRTAGPHLSPTARHEDIQAFRSLLREQIGAVDHCFPPYTYVYHGGNICDAFHHLALGAKHSVLDGALCMAGMDWYMKFDRDRFADPAKDGKPALDLVRLSRASRKFSFHSLPELHANRKNDFCGWKCSAGITGIYIDFDGNVFRGTCEVGGWYGNLYREGLHPSKNLDQWTTCPLPVCACGADMLTPKVKFAHMVPQKITELKDQVTTPGHFTRCDDVEEPDTAFDPFLFNAKAVTWDLTRRCNYSCTYCYPGSHNSYENYRSLGSLKHAVDVLTDQWIRGSSVSFQLAGGEPTLHPNYLELLAYIRLRNPHSVFLTTTNGSRESSFYRNLVLLSSITFSAHTESLDDGTKRSRFLENVQAAVETKVALELPSILNVSVMVKPGTLPLIAELVDEIRGLPNFKKSAHLSCCALHDTSEKSLVTYSQQEIEFIAEKNNVI